jgi:ABC-2 type transport system ATP-binding protein
LKTFVESIPGVNRVYQGAEHDSLEFETAPGQDARPEVARALVSQGYDLLEMRPVGMSLEEIFLKLTRDEPSPLDENNLTKEAESNA